MASDDFGYRRFYGRFDANLTVQPTGVGEGDREWSVRPLDFWNFLDFVRRGGAVEEPAVRTMLPSFAQQRWTPTDEND
jgi:hypothetical protein